MIRTCNWKHNLLAKRPDKVCQAVVNPRLLKPVKASKYSTTFQLFQQTGSFNGIDTCSATSYDNFNFDSKLSMEVEARSISNRHDLNEHLNKLTQDGVLSEFVEKGKRDFAEKYSRTIDYSKYLKGATYVSLENSMILQEELSNKYIQASLANQPGSRQITFFSQEVLASLFISMPTYICTWCYFSKYSKIQIKVY